jgi:ATP-dependent helicase/nuclease subunit B
VIGAEDVREDHEVHPQIMIWGTLEARVQGADLLVLGGLNDGIWPQTAPPDPWMNRQMRKAAGLLLPDRKIGLSAHDYQQAMAARTVVLTRATRDAEAETVPSRWLNRLTNLMSGLPDRGGPVALADMRSRGAVWLRHAAALELPAAPVPPSPRPSPAPPVEARPKVLSVTAIERLIRDPYAIYAQYVLRLRKLNPLRPEPDARLRGQVLHKVFEVYAQGPRGEARDTARARLMAVAAATLEAEIPWAAARLFWLARLDQVADFLLDFERAEGGVPIVLESQGRLALAPLDFTLTGRPDRIDMLPDGRLHIIDYKTGTPPSAKEQEVFAKQLLLLAAMAERGGFAGIGPVEVARITYLGLGTKPKAVSTDLAPEILGGEWEKLHRLITAYLAPDKGYTARRAVKRTQDDGDYDHLSRFGEWDAATPALTIRVGL